MMAEMVCAPSALNYHDALNGHCTLSVSISIEDSGLSSAILATLWPIYILYLASKQVNSTVERHYV